MNDKEGAMFRLGAYLPYVRIRKPFDEDRR